MTNIGMNYYLFVLWYSVMISTFFSRSCHVHGWISRRYHPSFLQTSSSRRLFSSSSHRGRLLSHGRSSLLLSSSSTTTSTTTTTPSLPLQSCHLTTLKPRMTVEERINARQWRSHYAPFIKQCVEDKDMQKVQEFRDLIMSLSNPRDAASFLTHLLSACEKAEDLSLALQIHQDLQSLQVPLTESSAISLIRCYTASGNFQEAWKIIILLDPDTLRLRTLQPIFQLLYQKNDLIGLLRLFAFCENKNIMPRNEEIDFLIQVYIKVILFQELPSLEESLTMNDKVINSTLPMVNYHLVGKKQQQKEKILERIYQLLAKASIDLFGIPMTTLEDITLLINKQSRDDLQREGVLAFHPSDLVVIDDKDVKTSGYFTAWNATYHNPTMFAMASLIPTSVWRSDRYLPVGMRPEDIVFTPQRYQVRLSQPTNESNIKHTAKSSPLPPSRSRGRLVHISGEDCLCPHCSGKLKNIELTPAEKEVVKDAIFKTIAERGSNQADNLKAFMQWLSQSPHFDYIIDGANVAYMNQNYIGGKFSYYQIDMLVRHLEAQGKRVLVIIPACYTPKNGVSVPNSIRHYKKREVLAEEDQAIIARLTVDNIMYAVPPGAYDDWYWMMASLMAPAGKQSFVVTNDLMRDHRLSFLAPKPFLRWRASQIVYYGFFYTPTDTTTATSESKVTEINIVENQGDVQNSTKTHVTDNSSNINDIITARIDNSNSSTTTVSEEDDVDSDCSPSTITMVDPANSNNTNSSNQNSLEFIASRQHPENVVLYPPGNYSRDIQFDENVKTWHLPASDRNSWLCLNLEIASDNSNNNSKVKRSRQRRRKEKKAQAAQPSQ